MFLKFVIVFYLFLIVYKGKDNVDDVNLLYILIYRLICLLSDFFVKIVEKGLLEF